ncbi:hypothetical protein [Curtobacterium sp. Leaf261]|uniref:hypothetical protein n=1 Tax=Curtobacterium sp. Leaf261 TaxID=1736311 RepID=UPI0006FD19AB|nr:hypothetical protein [Curtobacterium sp. Leaf261]KQO64692.1 hypothetical protein ASF23_00305 [Curtobacterium sp. Leaf261]
MIDSTRNGSSGPDTLYRYYPREVAAHVTLGAAAAALVRHDDHPMGPGESVAVTTACAALATRLGLLRHVVDPAVPAVPFTVWHEQLPAALLGTGTIPDRDRVVVAGDRCVAAWRRWATSAGTAADDVGGVAGALALGSWCSWATRSAAQARTRARYALDVDPSDPLARLVLGWCRARHGPAWRS